ncbi:hypothetical protein [Marinobacterium zhoushanense]|uniref:hypothetical protein n=1 Tax=Marinobacterium zhoushanense TaxID=1679163 RepID=UPI001665DBB7|nr:hypothetical protein [Marinobacterium zhoushanense]
MTSQASFLFLFEAGHLSVATIFIFIAVAASKAVVVVVLVSYRALGVPVFVKNFKNSMLRKTNAISAIFSPILLPATVTA